MKPGYVCILTNKPNGVLCPGVTTDLATRIGRHGGRAVPGFAKKYNCERLVRFGRFENVHDARPTGKRMKAWKRGWKAKRIEELNPEWRDLSDQWHLA